MRWHVLKQPKTFVWKVEGAIDHSTVSRNFKKFLQGCNNLDDQGSLGRPTNVCFEDLLKAIEPNIASSTQSVSGEHSISQSAVGCHLYILGESVQNYP